jgi:transcriptional regulator with XRE-family HTH domain
MLSNADYNRSNQIIGENLKRVRLQMGLTQTEVAIITNLDRSYICRIEKGKARVTFNLLRQLVIGLKIKSADLINF